MLIAQSGRKPTLASIQRLSKTWLPENPHAWTLNPDYTYPAMQKFCYRILAREKTKSDIGLRWAIMHDAIQNHNALLMRQFIPAYLHLPPGDIMLCTMACRDWQCAVQESLRAATTKARLVDTLVLVA